ncbi:hypothetical protein KJ682_03925 [bacterium]|nr:hypothetical protein [bacterium]
MKSFLVVLCAIYTALAASAGVSSSGEQFAEHIEILNRRIESAIAEGREWPKFPGGLANILFGHNSYVGHSRIFFPAESENGASDNQWREALISKHSDGSWRVIHIRPCEKSEFSELVDRCEFLRQSSITRMGLDYTKQGPLELLELLKRSDRNYWVSPLLPFGWVKETHLPALIALLDSRESCANVQNMLSSYIDTTRSTVGNEAAYLIEGFIKDRYPPRLNSTRPFCDIEEIKKWWEERQGT